MFYMQEWTECVQRMSALPPLPEVPVPPEFVKLLTKDPYKVPVKKGKGKKNDRAKS